MKNSNALEGLFTAPFYSSSGSNNKRTSIFNAFAILSTVSKEKVFLQALLDSIFLINS